MQRLARLANTLLARAETAEVLSSLGHEIRVELHGDAASRLAANGNVEKDTRPRGLSFRSHYKVRSVYFDSEAESWSESRRRGREQLCLAVCGAGSSGATAEFEALEISRDTEYCRQWDLNSRERVYLNIPCCKAER